MSDSPVLLQNRIYFAGLEFPVLREERTTKAYLYYYLTALAVRARETRGLEGVVWEEVRRVLSAWRWEETDSV